MNHEDQELLALFEGLDTPGVSDAMDKLGLPGQCLGIAPLDNYAKAVVGPAFTVKYVAASTPAGTVGDFIDDVAEGDIVEAGATIALVGQTGNATSPHLHFEIRSGDRPVDPLRFLGGNVASLEREADSSPVGAQPSR